MPDEPSFSGTNAADCERFITAIRKRALTRDKHNDNAWIAAYAASCLEGPALRWFEEQEDNVQEDWKLLRRALLQRYDSQNNNEDISSTTIDENPYIPVAAAAAPPPPAFGPPAPIATRSFSASSQDLPPAPNSFGPRRGLIRIEADDPSVSGYVSRNKNVAGQFIRSSDKSEALFVTLGNMGSGSAETLLLGSSETWLGLTWPNLKSSEWSTENTFAACLATVSKTWLFRRSKTSSDVKGATNHRVWHVTSEGELVATYPEDDGTPRVLQALASPKDMDIRFVCSATEHINRRRGDRCQIRLILEAM